MPFKKQSSSFDPKENSLSGGERTWFHPAKEVDKILAPVSAPDRKPPAKVGDITRCQAQELMQLAWYEVACLAHAEDVIGQLKADLLVLREESKMYEAKFRYQRREDQKSNTDLSLARDEKYCELQKLIVEKEAMSAMLTSRVDAYRSRNRVLSRELTRRGMEFKEAR